MPEFRYTFRVSAPLQAVAQFHRDPRALTRLTPPPIFIRMHRVEPMAEAAVSELTMWFGPVPVRWVAIHHEVDRLHGFTDEQQVGPLARWVHTHHFTAEGETVTRIEEVIRYDHHTGPRGWLTRILFSRPALWMLFTYRQMITRTSLEPRNGGPD